MTEKLQNRQSIFALFQLKKVTPVFMTIAYIIEGCACGS